MKKVTLYALYILLAMFFYNDDSVSAWQIPIEVSTVNSENAKVYNRLVAGVESGATDNFDNMWDTPALNTSPDPANESGLTAYILGKPFSTLRDSDAATRLWKDIRGPVSDLTRWDLVIDSVPEGRSVVVSWSLPQGVLKAGERLVLQDDDMVGPDGKPVAADLIGKSNYVFVSNGEGAKRLSLVLSKETKSSSDSGGSGFGCGTVKSQNDGPPDSGAAAVIVIIIFSPLIFIRMLRRSFC